VTFSREIPDPDNNLIRRQDSPASFPQSSSNHGYIDMKLINIGFGNVVSAEKVITIVSPESAPIKRIIGDARDRGQLIDATYGRRTRAVITTNSGHVILSSIQPETVAYRFVTEKGSDSPKKRQGNSSIKKKTKTNRESVETALSRASL
jgi:extracellular matrix regulatory protein A